ncbi:MAG: hypothetical protein GY751_06890 [Bacteroidetes bacterium]|nr:hypothetical protein [Bacteroidota bacterium]
MSFRKRSYAFFLLILFAAVVFHDLLPHVHHDHEDISEITHHEDHHHEHEGAIAVLGHVLQLHHHHHSGCEIDVCPEVPVVKQENQDDKDPSQAIRNNLDALDIPVSESLNLDWTASFDVAALMQSISKRGPPADNC